MGRLVQWDSKIPGSNYTDGLFWAGLWEDDKIKS